MADFDSEPPLLPPPLLQTPAPSTNLLMGPMGLRAGWGIALFLLVSFLLMETFVVGGAKVSGRGQQMREQQTQAHLEAEQARKGHPSGPLPIRLSNASIYETSEAAAVLLAGLGLSFLERRRFGVYGLRTRFLRDLLPGALWGFLAMSLLVLALRALHLLVFDGRLLHGASIAKFGLAWLALFFLVGVFEEFVFRGYIQFTLTRGLLRLGRRLAPEHGHRAAFWLSAVFWSLLFLTAHIPNAGENPLGLLSVFWAGILFSYALWRTGSLWWGIGFHMTWDWAQSFLYGVPDSGTLAVSRLFATHPAGRRLLSGGVDGPEGSILGMGVFVLMLVVIRLHPQADQPPLAPESLPAHLHSPRPEPIA